MLVTALSPVIGYDKAAEIAHYALDNDLSLKHAAVKLGYVTADEFDRVVDPAKMVKPYVAGPRRSELRTREDDMAPQSTDGTVANRTTFEPATAVARCGRTIRSRRCGAPCRQGRS